MSKLIDDIVVLTREGWRPYRGHVQSSVYENLDCRHGLLTHRETRTRPYWFSRGELFLCVGCSRKCGLNRPAGFEPPLPIRHRTPPEQVYHLTPQELVSRKALLNVYEAAYCLNVSNNSVYRYIYEGRLPATKDRPIRVRASDVAAMMENIDE